MSVPVKIVILLHKKKEKKYEVSQTFKPNTRLSVRLTILAFNLRATQNKNHGLDYFTETNSPKASN